MKKAKPQPRKKAKTRAESKPAGQADESFRLKREQLIFYMKSINTLKSDELEKAFSEVKRELFVPEHLKQVAYADEALPLGLGQTISQPSTIAIMLEMLEVKEGMKVLEIGVGSGYVQALLSKLVGEKGKVYGLELLPELVKLAKKNLAKANIKNCEIKEGDGCQGWPEKKLTFDRIIISAACPFVPKPLISQLKEKGVVVAPVGDEFGQEMVKATKFKGKLVKSRYLQTWFSFVPLQGMFGKKVRPGQTKS